MRSAILMGSVAMVALAGPAFALPDRYEQGYSCTGAGVMCTQELMREDGNKFDDKVGDAAGTAEGALNATSTDRSLAAARATGDDNFGSSVENTADEAGDEISEEADEAGDEIENAADEAGDELDEAGDEIEAVFD